MTLPTLSSFRSVPRGQRRQKDRRYFLRRFPILERLEDRTLPSGGTAQPTYMIFTPLGTLPSGSPTPRTTAFTPAQIKQAYGINLVDGDGTGETIAIVDAYDDPDFVSRSSTVPVNADTAFLNSDLHQFDVQYGLPEPPGFFTKVDSSGGTNYPITDPTGAGSNSWEAEEALDVEWAHAVAPGAKIILVEAHSNSDSDLDAAVTWAGSNSGAQVVSMSWGGGEFSGENSEDSVFVQPPGYGVTYLASTGDFGAPGGYPAYSPNVVAVGGTTLTVSGNGNYGSEAGWSFGSDPYATYLAGGGGISQFEPQPSYQSNLVIHNGTGIISANGKRTIPDISLDADPSTGVSVYDNYDGSKSGGPWYQFGGTSVSCPCWAALIGIADQLRADIGEPSLSGPGQVLPALYQMPASDFHDITTGNNGYAAGPGYDLVTGLGTPVTNTLVSDLAYSVPISGELHVTSSLPAAGATVATPPTSYTLAFSLPINSASLQASALSVNGIPASNVAVNASGTTATFTFGTSPVTIQGAQTLVLAAGAITAMGSTVKNVPNNARFYYDVLPLVVQSAEPASGSIIQLPVSSIPVEITFNEPIDPTLVNIGNLVLSQGTVASAVAQPGNETVDYTLTGMTTDGNLTVTLPAGVIKDQYGNPASPTITATYFLDNPTQAFSPLQAVEPLGSLVYQGSLSGTIAFAADTDNFTLPLQTGQTITVVGTPASRLQMTVELTDPNNNVLGLTTSVVAGQSTILQSIPATSTGVYGLTVTGAGSSLGAYTLSAVVDAAAQFGPANNTLGGAQDIDASFVSLGGVASRGAVLGTTNVISGQDYYSFSLSAGDNTTLAVKSLGSSPAKLTLEDPSGATVASGVTPVKGLNLSLGIPGSTETTPDSLVTDFVVPSSGTYYALVTGTPGRAYSLVITRNTELANGGNLNQATAQPVIGRLGDGMEKAVGYLGNGHIVETFDDGSLARYGMVGSNISIIPAAAHDGPLGLSDEGVWTWRTDAAAQVREGETFSVWTQIPDTFSGFAAFGFGATGFINSLWIQMSGGAHHGLYLYFDNGYNVFGYTPYTWQPNKWYRLEVTWNIGGQIIGRVYDSDGTTLITTVTGTYKAQTSGGIAFGGNNDTSAALGSVYFDTVAINGVSDSNFYHITLDTGTSFGAETATAASGQVANSLDPELILYNAAGMPVASDDNSVPDGRNALLTYVVPAGQGGDYYLQVTASSATANPTTGEYTLSMSGLSPSEAIGTVSLPNWTVNQPGYHQTVSASGGAGALTFTSTGTLPPGLTLSGSGLLSGTPMAVGSYTFTVSVTDGAGDTGSHTYAVVINPPVNITTATLVNGTLDAPYSQSWSVAGGTGSLTYSISGALPPGLTMTGTGVLSGTPTAVGRFAFTVTATDGVGASASKSYTLVIFVFGPFSLPSWTANLLGYNQTIAAIGGIGPNTYSVTGTLPPGLTFTSRGILSGVPTVAGLYTFTVTATDTQGASSTGDTFTITINPQPAFVIGITAVATFNTMNGAYPEGGLLQDSSGNLFGTTSQGGAYGDGTIFEMPHGSQQIVTLASFDGMDGANPEGTLIEDSGGDLFGATAMYGSNGRGTVFELPRGSTTIVTLAAFPPGVTGVSGLTEDSSGDLFGTTPNMIFEVRHGSGTITTLANLQGTIEPLPVIVDSSGNLFGTVADGPTYIYGIVFELPSGSNTIRTLATFDSTNGSIPDGPVLEDSNGNLFGTTLGGGANGYGTIFEIRAGSDAITTLATFNGSNGAHPYGGLVQDSNGNLFGATQGAYLVVPGTVFELPSGSNTITTLFSGVLVNVQETLAEDSDGNYFGVTGKFGGFRGGVFEVGSFLANGTVNQPHYSQTIGVSGGTGALTFTLTGGTLPTGLSLSPIGVLSGTPTATGSFSFLVTITDTLGASASYGYTVVINPPVAILTPLLNGALGQGYNETINAIGGTGSLTYIVTGSLPTGLTCSSTGVLSGTPTTAGQFTFTITATDTAGVSNSRSYTLFVFSFSPTMLPGWTVNVPGYHQTITVSGGSSPYTFSTGNTPPGLTLSSGGILTSEPTLPGDYAFTVTATDSRGVVVSATLTVTINPAPALSRVLITLVNFNDGDGAYPQGNLVMDSSGDIFGTTSFGGAASAYTQIGNQEIRGVGTVFEIPSGTGRLIPIASFDISNGAFPTAGVTLDSSGDLFGDTLGFYFTASPGTVFEIPHGTNSITTLARFASNDGAGGGVIADSGGNVFGATTIGASGEGSVFEIRNGSGIITPLANFNGLNGATPLGLLWEDSSGNLFGTTENGGQYGYGTVFEVQIGSNDITTLANFNSLNGALPGAGVFQDSNGNFFGTTAAGGNSGDGTVFELPSGGNSIRSLGSFTGDNGYDPVGLPIADAMGNLFGATSVGSVYELLRGSDTITNLSTAGGNPTGSLVMDSNGNLFGTTQYGGQYGYGTVFEVGTQLPGWTVGLTGYNQTLGASGGTGALTFKVTGGTLPTGLLLSSAGILSGMPKTVGTFQFSVNVTDMLGASGSLSYSMTINPGLMLPQTVLPDGIAGEGTYDAAIPVSGGTGPYSFAGGQNALPPGLAMSPDGIIYGTPFQAGRYTFGVMCTDAAGSVASQLVTITIDPEVTIITVQAANWTVNQPGYSQTFKTAGGIGTKTFNSSGTLPPGLTLSTSGILFGTPTATGSYLFTVTATDSFGASNSRSFNVTVNPALTFASPNSITWTANYAFTEDIIASGGTGGKAYMADAASLPPGLLLAPEGTLSGTPTMAGSYMFTIVVTDSTGASASQIFTNVINPPVMLTPATLPNWTGNQGGYSQTFTASGGTGSLTFSHSGTLPGGLTFSGSTVLSGTPTAVGNYTFTVKATDSAGASSARTYSVTINPPVALPALTLPPDTVNVAFSQTITASGGTGDIMLAVTNMNGAIPGLSVLVSGSDSVSVTGTPTAAGTETFTITAGDSLGSMASQSYAVIVNPPLAITTTTLPSWTTELAGYSQTIGATGGTGTLTFTTSSLPPGLTLSSTGFLSGTPAMAGRFDFTVTATDAVGASGSQEYTVLINPPVAVAATTLPPWTADLTGYSATFNASGGTGSLTFSMSGTLPPGLSLSSNGVLDGTPTAAGSYGFLVIATDGLGASASQSFAITINPPPTLNPGVLPVGLVNIAYNQTITPLGGTGAVTLAVSNLSGVIAGLSVSGGGSGPVAITGTPTATGTEHFTVTATDFLGVTTAVDYSVTINPATVYLTLPNSGYSGSPGGTILSFPISINELQDQSSTNHVGLQSASFAVRFATGVFNFPVGANNASSYVGLGSVPLSDAVSPGGAADWTLSATSPSDGQLNITLTAKSGKAITSDNPAAGGSLVIINLPISASYNPTSPTAVPITVASANGAFHTAITGSNGAYILKPAPPYAGSVTVNPSGTGAFSQYLVSVVGSSTMQAGSSVLLAVQAADAQGNAVTSYSGPSTVTPNISSPGAFPSTVSINSHGLGLFLVTFWKAGSCPVSVSSGTYVSNTISVAVTPGPAAALAFIGQPEKTPTGVGLPPVTVQVQDLYGNAITSDNTDSVMLSVASGPGSFTASSTTIAPVHNGVATFSNLMLVTPGSYSLSAVIPSLFTGPNSNPFSIAPLQVIPGSFTGTPSGFSLQFIAPFLLNSTTPVLYGKGFGISATAPSVILTTDPDNLSDTAAYVAGSLVLDPADNRITFVTTTTANRANSPPGAASPLLPDGVYTAIVRGSTVTDGFQALDNGGGYLDGLGTGVPGSGDFMATFTVNAQVIHDDIVWIPPAADGPGQALNAPGRNQLGGGYPIYLSDSTGTVTEVQITLNYNPALLAVTGVSGPGFALLASSTPGQAVLQYTGPALPVGVETPIGYLLATVPAGTAASPVPYKTEDLLHLSNVALNSGAIVPLATADAVHLVTYVGDADGNGNYTSNDAVLITRALLHTDSGFSAYPLVDPVIVADTDGVGFIPSDAALQANEAGAGLATPNLAMPPIPRGVHFQAVVANLGPNLLNQAAHQQMQARTTAAARHVVASPAADVLDKLNWDEIGTALDWLWHSRKRNWLF
jgi:large repetitive protein